jgi:hypothetical protein
VFTPTGKKWIIVTMVAITTWFAASMVFWAGKPLHDYAPTGKILNTATPDPNDTVDTSIRVTCASPWSSSIRTVPLPALEAPRSYQDTPCASSHRDGRLILFVDIAVFVLAIAGGVLLLTRRTAIEPPLKPALA